LDIDPIRCDLAPGMGGLTFARHVTGWLGHLREDGAKRF